MIDKRQLGRGQLLKHKVGACFLEAICAGLQGVVGKECKIYLAVNTKGKGMETRPAWFPSA